MPDDCIFCKIIAKNIPSDTVYEDESIYAFRDLEPQAPTHVLVVPKLHIENLADAAPHTAELLGKVMLGCAEVARREGIEVDGYRTILNTNRAAGQVVYHLHAHVLGGRKLGALVG